MEEHYSIILSALYSLFYAVLFSFIWGYAFLVIFQQIETAWKTGSTVRKWLALSALCFGIAPCNEPLCFEVGCPTTVLLSLSQETLRSKLRR